MGIFNMEVERSKVILVSDFKCCRKYKHTLPNHVELVGGDDSDSGVSDYSLHKFVPVSMEVPRPASSQGHSKTDLSSNVGTPETDILETTDENLEDDIFDAEDEMIGEESEDEITVCSDWIVLKQQKKRRMEAHESSVTDQKELDVPDADVCKPPEKMIPSGFVKYKDFCKDLPKTPPLKDEALRKRAPSPNSSMPRSDVGMYETKGEDWLWFEGRYLEGGTWEVAAGEDGEYYRMQKQWKEGHWEPAPWLVEKWEREELELEKERLKELEEKRKYDEILKREDSPGMDIVNWGQGPVKLTRWKEVSGGLSIQDFSKSLPKSLSDKFLEETLEMTPEDIEKLTVEVKEAMKMSSFDENLNIMSSYFTEDLAVALSEVLVLNTQGNEGACKSGICKSCNCKLIFVPLTESKIPEPGSELTKSLKSKHKKTVEVEISCDVIPEDFRKMLLDFARQFVDDLPSDPLGYAVEFFEDRSPRMDLVDEEMKDEGASPFQFLDERRKSMTEPSAYSIDLSDAEKTEAQVEMIITALHECWLLKDLDISCFIALVREMYRLTVSANTSVRTLEDEADHMYVIESGTYQLSNRKGTFILKDRGSFGDVSLVGLYNIKFPYDVVALTDGALWCLHKHSYINATRKMNIHREKLMSEMMMGIELFDNLYEEEFYKLIHCVELKYYQKGDVLFCENTKPEGIYFVLFGDGKLIKMDEQITKTKRGKIKTVKRLKNVGIFTSPHALGHDNIMYGDPWDYSCVARSHILEVALLKTDVMERLVGDVDDILNRPINEIMTLHEKAKTQEFLGEDEDERGEWDEMEMIGEFETATEEATLRVPSRLSINKPNLDDMI